MCVCVCVGEMGVDRLVSDDLRERLVACACVYARARIWVSVGARVPASTRTIVCLCSSDPIVCAYVPAMLALEPARNWLADSFTSPPSSIHPSVRPSVRPSIHPSVHFSRIRASIPLQSIIFPVPKEGAKNQLSLGWAGGTKSSPDASSQRFTHLPADKAWEERGALSPFRSPLSYRRGPSRSLPPLGPRGRSSERDPGSRVLLTTSHSC